LKEVETHLILANRVDACSEVSAGENLAEADALGLMLHMLIVRLEAHLGR